jgi:hypothetical protein
VINLGVMKYSLSFKLMFEKSTLEYLTSKHNITKLT